MPREMLTLNTLRQRTFPFLRQRKLWSPQKNKRKERRRRGNYSATPSLNKDSPSCFIQRQLFDVYSAFAVIFNILCLEAAYDSMRLLYWYLHIYDLILYLCIMYYIVCYLTGIFYAVVRQISMLFIDNKNSVFCILERSICQQDANMTHS